MAEPVDRVRMPGLAEPTIYDVARVAGVAPSTVSRALSIPGRVSFRTAEHVRQVAEELGYRTGLLERKVSDRGTGMLVIVVADIANPVFFGIIRGAERAATGGGFTLLERRRVEMRTGPHVRLRPVSWASGPGRGTAQRRSARRHHGP